MFASWLFAVSQSVETIGSIVRCETASWRVKAEQPQINDAIRKDTSSVKNAFFFIFCLLSGETVCLKTNF
jgi:hypothetical protein